MANMRTQEGNTILKEIWKTLSAKNILIIYKIMLVKDVLLAKMTYGIEMFGGRYSNLEEIKKILHTA